MASFQYVLAFKKAVSLLLFSIFLDFKKVVILLLFNFFVALKRPFGIPTIMSLLLAAITE